MLMRTLFLVAAALVAAAPAQAQRGGSRCSVTTRSTDRRPQNPADSTRAVLRQMVVDSVESDVGAAARQAGIAQPAGLVVMVIRGRAPERAEIHTHEANVGADIVRAALARRAPLLAALPEHETTLHFRLDPLPTPPGDTLRVEECVPRVANVDRFRREIQDIERREPPVPGVMPRTTVHVRMLVSRDGEVAFATVTRRSGNPAVERRVLEATGALRFQPATVNGTPMDVWVELPVQLELQGPSTSRRP
jgi:TonB family protein